MNRVTKFSHPFRALRRREHNYDKIEKKGWLVMDVKGDDNCGYYALLYALENVGITD
jgi:hypothetical protein